MSNASRKGMRHTENNPTAIVRLFRLKKKGGPVKNLELVKKGWENHKRYPNVTLHYVKAHTDGEDEHSLGNAQADRLAVEGSKVCIMKK